MFRLNFLGKLYKVLKMCGKSWSKFEQETTTIPTPRTLELLASMKNPLLIFSVSFTLTIGTVVSDRILG